MPDHQANKSPLVKSNGTWKRPGKKNNAKVNFVVGYKTTPYLDRQDMVENAIHHNVT